MGVFCFLNRKRLIWILPVGNCLYLSIIRYFWVSTEALRDAQGGLIWPGPMWIDFCAISFIRFIRHQSWFVDLFTGNGFFVWCVLGFWNGSIYVNRLDDGLGGS
jgi:hypothetical protein